ncbi:DUF4130 domain-containing protein [Robertkochia sediminum]|uniref:DUF4130 domain-containing protein n=1 Tax=Robertkochia sediminum TaxID=2785326 RepID=UPI0019329AB4|nr:DUF4130 domain-containing protein [Robertkochia sediminum]MBL7472955.1 DUF4130 domain-containing protein [Robertkochia sediminum]
MKTVLIYDGSFKGLLTAVYTVFEKDVQNVVISREEQADPGLFTCTLHIETDPLKASGVWRSLRLKAGSGACDQLYKAFLSELKGAENGILEYVALAYGEEHFQPDTSSAACVKKIAYAAQMVSRSEQRCYDYVCNAFQENHGKWIKIQPDFNVLPLLAKRLRNERSDLAWVLYDLKRSYGFHYDMETLEPVFEAPVGEADMPVLTHMQSGLKVS